MMLTQEQHEQAIKEVAVKYGGKGFYGVEGQHAHHDYAIRFTVTQIKGHPSPVNFQITMKMSIIWEIGNEFDYDHLCEYIRFWVETSIGV